jgi:DNA-binding FrmR family transcriptional regulator
MVNDHKHQSHPDIIKRLKRARGHLESVIGMMDQGKPCLDLAQQLHAVAWTMPSGRWSRNSGGASTSSRQ